MRNDPMVGGVESVVKSAPKNNPNKICPRTGGKALLSKPKMAFPQFGTSVIMRMSF